MIAATRRWLRRNRANIGIGVGVVGATYLAGQYVVGKISETRERMTSDRIAKENLRRRFKQNQEDCTFTVLALLPTAAENVLDALPVENITHELQQQRAEKLGRSTATSEVSPSDMSSTTSPPREESSQAESFLHTSQMETESGKAPEPRKTKAQLWSELKISSITRSFTMIYTVAFLTLLTRIQLNLLGRRNYLSSVVSLAASAGKDPTINLENHDDDKINNNWGTDFDTNRKYLTFSWWLLHRGWRDIMQKVQTAVQEVFGPLNPREDITFERLSQLIIEVRKKVEGETEDARRTHKWLEYLLPAQEQEDYVLQESGILVDNNGASPQPDESPINATDPTNPHPPTLFSQMPCSLSTDPLRRLLDETSDLIDSPTATHILTLLLDTLYSQLTDVAIKQQAFKLVDPPFDPAAPRVQEITDGERGQTTAKLATILAVITRQAHLIGNGVPNEYVQALEDVRDLEAFAAVVYSSNFELEAIVRAEAEGQHVEQASLSESEKSRAGIIGSTWGVFEGVWNRVAGK